MTLLSSYSISSCENLDEVLTLKKNWSQNIMLHVMEILLWPALLPLIWLLGRLQRKLFTVNFFTGITKPRKIIENTTSLSVPVSFCMFSCSKGLLVRAYLGTI